MPGRIFRKKIKPKEERRTMKISNTNSGGFKPCPDYSGSAVCVDVTPPQTVHSQYGDRKVFKVVFEVDEAREDGKRFAVWSAPFTPNLGEKANFRKFTRSWFGRDLTAQELDEFETEDLIGKPAHLVVSQQEAENGNTYSNIVVIKPDKSTSPLKPSGDFVRKKDREDKPTEGSGSRYSRVEQPEGASREDWMKTKVHVGKHEGVELGELDEDAVITLIENWLPGFRGTKKPRAADKRLAAALVEAEKALNTTAEEEEESPY
ncbi:MAG: hypothetical protein R3F07_03925 [Opitutaceae bacterium]